MILFVKKEFGILVQLTYHAMARGIRRMVILQDDTDYQVFLLLLKKMMEKHECKSKKKIINLQICFPLKKD